MPKTYEVLVEVVVTPSKWPKLLAAIIVVLVLFALATTHIDKRRKEMQTAELVKNIAVTNVQVRRDCWNSWPSDRITEYTVTNNWNEVVTIRNSQASWSQNPCTSYGGGLDLSYVELPPGESVTIFVWGEPPGRCAEVSTRDLRWQLCPLDYMQ